MIDPPVKASGRIIGVRRRAEYYVTVTSTRLWDVLVGCRAVFVSVFVGSCIGIGSLESEGVQSIMQP